MLDAGTAVPLAPLGEHELLVFWCQLLVLLFAARLGGYVARRLGQPRVIGELLAGVALGPSLFGRVWRDGWEWLFPDDGRQAGLLLGLAWFGIVLLLMMTGAELDIDVVRRSGRAALWTGIGSLVVPFGAGVLAGWLLPSSLIGPESERWVFAVFMGVAMAISSLPVAARILSDLGLLGTRVGQLVLTVATANDVIGWLLLGVVVTVAEGGSASITRLAVAILGMVAIGSCVVGPGVRWLDVVTGAVERREGGPAAQASLIVLFTVAVGAATHAIGVEVVIGAFFAGVAIGRSSLGRGPAMGHLEVAGNAVFAPLFFVVAGLRVDLGAFDESDALIAAVVVVSVATASKLIGSYAGGRIGRLSPRASFIAAAALNARGALEVVVATVGLSTGVLSESAYAAIVVMAIVTSAITGPLIGLAEPNEDADTDTRVR